MDREPNARDAYQVLHIRPDAPQVVVDAAFRALASIYHPDVSTMINADARMAELNKAYAQIRTPDLRAVYDKLGNAPLPQAKAWNMGAAPAPPPPRRAANGDSATIDFGRYDGWTIADLATHDPDYLRWLSRHTSGHRYRREIDERLAAAGNGNAASATATSSRNQGKPQRRWGRLGI